MPQDTQERGQLGMTAAERRCAINAIVRGRPEMLLADLAVLRITPKSEEAAQFRSLTVTERIIVLDTAAYFKTESLHPSNHLAFIAALQHFLSDRAIRPEPKPL